MPGVADLVYLRHSTDKQTDACQRHALTALLIAGAPVYEDPAISSRQLSLDRAGFTTLLHEAAVGDTIRIADAACLFRSVADILALRPVLLRRGLHLRVESGLLSGIDLAGDDPGTKMMVSVLAAVLEFQRDMIAENTGEGVAAAKAAGKTLGRPAAFDHDKATTIVEEYRQGAAVKALARRHQVAPRPSAVSWTPPTPATCPASPTRRRPTSASRIACPRWARTRPSICRDCSPITCVPLVMKPSARPSPARHLRGSRHPRRPAR
ncbi:recombinase family protein [Microbispora sp. H10830]|uniref:recombinase family protein n=1 Tax=Microbispora sp. H10830 TaxID=2729109 RepID=UPI0021759CB4|nr:recombinase family protein [Microbispora sp. H10830]